MPIQISKQFSTELSRAVFFEMIEDVELTRRILEHFAQDSVGYPANLSFEDMCQAFDDVGHESMTYHLKCACDAGLLEADYNETHMMSDGVLVTFGWLSGLTVQGSDYVHQSRSSMWGKAIESLKKHKVTVTTSVLAEFIPSLVRETLGI